MAQGKVVLVGSGPGDPGLMTVKGKEMLAAAEVIVYDRLVGNEVFEFAPQAQLINVGKQQGHHPVPQEKINQILVREALKGQFVVRLKGGDPYVFGRGPEEVEELVKHGIDFEVVPGVTSALSALSYAGIPATSRGVARSVHIITGHAKEDEPLEIDYEALVRTQGTLVFLMAVTSMKKITEGLLEAGMSAQMPAAIIENGTLPTQRSVRATLSAIVDEARAQKVQSPAILTIGEVCNEAPTLDWFSHRPLRGKTIIVTRPRARAGTLAKRLEALGAEVIQMPCIETRPLKTSAAKEALERIGSYSWIVLTSPYGAERLFDLIDEIGADVRMLAPVKLAAIGASTARALSTRGIRADYVPEQFDAKHLGEGLAARLTNEDRVLLLRAEKGTSELVEAFSAQGIAVDDVASYETVLACEKAPEIEQRLQQGDVDYATFSSASTVEGFSTCIPNAAAYDFIGVSIGESTDKAARACGYNTIVADNATIDCMVDILLEEVSR